LSVPFGFKIARIKRKRWGKWGLLQWVVRDRNVSKLAEMRLGLYAEYVECFS